MIQRTRFLRFIDRRFKNIRVEEKAVNSLSLSRKKKRKGFVTFPERPKPLSPPPLRRSPTLFICDFPMRLMGVTSPFVSLLSNHSSAAELSPASPAVKSWKCGAQNSQLWCCVVVGDVETRVGYFSRRRKGGTEETARVCDVGCGLGKEGGIDSSYGCGEKREERARASQQQAREERRIATQPPLCACVVAGRTHARAV